MREGRGVTVVELLVVLILLGLMAGVVGLTLRTAQPVRHPDAAHLAATQARDSAIHSGRPVTIVFTSDSQRLDITALPDGQLVADARLAIDPLTGRANAAR